MAPQQKAYGTWSSPISTDLITSKAIQFPSIHPSGNQIIHAESRPSEGGRIVLVSRALDALGEEHELFGQGWNARTQVHEYGGGAVAVEEGSGGRVWFSEFRDGRLYEIGPGQEGELRAVTPADKPYRYADFVPHPTQPHILISVLEDHTLPSPSTVVTKLVAIDTRTSSLTTLAEGADFYASPRVSADGEWLAWREWYHPDMPWEGTQLYVARLSFSPSPALSSPRHVAGARSTESISQPLWSPSSAPQPTLYYLSDSTNYTQPYSFTPGSPSPPTPLLRSPTTDEWAPPDWTFGNASYTLLSPNTLLAAPTRSARAVLGLLDLPSREWTELPTPYSAITHLHALSPTRAVFVSAQTQRPVKLVLAEFELGEGEGERKSVKFRTLKSSSTVADDLPQGIFSQPDSITFKAPQPAGRVDADVNVIFYPPSNPDYVGKENTRPPAVFAIHGGPTSQSVPGLNWLTAFFTSRGWAWIDVNYGGSSGFGRQYRERLTGQWGVVDTSDVVESVKYLAKRGLIDDERVAIRGGSAGGFTVLASLTDSKVFSAGTSLYGVSDLRALAEDTHKFESQYLFRLIGGTPEEVPDIYRDRSPINKVEHITSALLVLQGSDDKVVPPNQAELVVDRLKALGRTVEYELFDGEGHGFRKAETVKKALERELAFYTRVFGLGE